VPERPQLRVAEQALVGWRSTLTETLGEIAADLRREDHPVLDAETRHGFMRRAADDLRSREDEAIDGVIAADQSVRFSVRSHARREQVRGLADSVDRLQRVSLHVQAISLGVDELYDRTGIQPRLDRLTMAQLALDLADMVRSSSTSPPADVSAAMCRTVDAALDAVTHGGPDLSTVLESVSLLGRVDQLRRELLEETAIEIDARGR
jgi:hypothetical protein